MRGATPPYIIVSGSCEVCELLHQEPGVDTWLGKFVLALAGRFRELDQKLGAGDDSAWKA